MPCVIGMAKLEGNKSGKISLKTSPSNFELPIYIYILMIESSVIQIKVRELEYPIIILFSLPLFVNGTTSWITGHWFGK